jgi:hypothetical protein
MIAKGCSLRNRGEIASPEQLVAGTFLSPRFKTARAGGVSPRIVKLD